MQDLNVAIIQSSLYWEDRQANLSAFDAHLAGINQSVDLIVLPEMFSTGFSMRCELFAESVYGESLNWMKKTAYRLNSYIAGSIMVKENENFYNRLYLVSPDSSYVHYDKRHLFRMGDENLYFTQGNKRVVAQIGDWKLLLQVCYDLRFPVWLMNSAKDEIFDYDAILLVANWPAARSRVWKTLLNARAIDNQCYVIGVNRTGTDGRGTNHSGDSMILSPRGEILADCHQDENASAITVLSAENLFNFRQQFKVSLDWDNFNIIL
jgi:predicted amidohydrolase